jgi:hypothetical protein
MSDNGFRARVAAALAALAVVGALPSCGGSKDRVDLVVRP